jgi:hypothetical protein
MYQGSAVLLSSSQSTKEDRLICSAGEAGVWLIRSPRRTNYRVHLCSRIGKMSTCLATTSLVPLVAASHNKAPIRNGCGGDLWIDAVRFPR